mmetsp:Transcript_26850/g.43162  ORF Transcript_26850/g.43162 Transcript_26850/m.43162 type:complete len:124 (+) Transcript_26850:421-792(+)
MCREELVRYTNEADEERQGLIVENNLMAGNTSAMEAGIRRLNETTETGGVIMSDLKGQSEQLKRTVDRVLDTGEVLKESKRVLDGMARAATTNKLTTALIILLEIFVICVIFYFKFVAPGSKT